LPQPGGIGWTRIEFEDPIESRCGCCGAQQRVLTRFVSREGAAFAVYRGVLTLGHGQPRADMVISLGDWSDDAPPEERMAFVFQLWSDPDNINVTIVEPDESAWNSGLLGTLMPKADALRHPLIGEVYNLVDHIMMCDAEVIAYLADPA
jgi:hypothetical protein